MRRPVLLTTLGALLGLAAAQAVAHSNATPAASPFASPRAATCSGSRRPPEFFLDLVGTPAASNATARAGAISITSGTPAPLPTGPPADPLTVAAITAVMEAVVACFNAGDFARTAALFTDDFWRQEVRGMEVVAQGFAEAAAQPPTPVPPDERETLVGIREVRVLAAERIGAMVELETARAGREVSFVVFVDTPDGWRIGDVTTNPPPEAASTPAP